MLHRERGIRPSDAYYRMPAWEVDLLVEGLQAEGRELERQDRDMRRGG